MGKSYFMVPLTFHTEYSPVIATQLDTGATCIAMLYTNLLNILQSEEVELDPPGGKRRLYNVTTTTSKLYYQNKNVELQYINTKKVTFIQDN